MLIVAARAGCDRIRNFVAGKCWQRARFMADQRGLKRKGADYHHGDLRRSLVEATVRLVAEHGVDGFTLRAAAKLAGVSDGAPYHHFADKEALLAYVAEESFDLLCEEMTTAGDGHAGGPHTKAQAMSVAYVLFAARYPARFRIMWSPRGRARHRYQALERAARRADRLLAACLSRSLAGASARTVSLRRITVARAVVHGLAVLAIDGHLGIDGARSRALKRLAWDAMRDLIPPEPVDAESRPKKPPRSSISPESAPRSGSRLRPTRQIA